ncbi:DUF2568 domain-containing protein [Nocardia otitidiscaviarum]|uniref:DUF2568 domain-containing protein n=1 Tax=Nocardia otitidiscaviarum TaxID=1823 RepID=A0A516NKR1_9NOCA|nr:DUF2568 domain-containing protein [Nocardia otitidiscaviarum]MCP9618806.1 YrdB family protein [Nocardia otitidiscaviarum]QDP79497.1 DUF2568 domain-containing protein [Nocardia otitidiscaviarum]
MSMVKGANMLLMFLLELGVLGAAVAWGLTRDAPLVVRVVAAAGALTAFIVIWALFGAAKDARYRLTGWARAALELGWFGGGALLLAAAWSLPAGVVFFAVWALNYALRRMWRQV